MNLPKLFAAADLNWERGDQELPGMGRVPFYRGVDWLSQALIRMSTKPTPDWTFVMARACCHHLAQLEEHTGPEEMAEHLPEALNDEWTYHHEYAAWIGSDPSQAFAQLDRVRAEIPELDTAQVAELAMQREAFALGVNLIRAAEREWQTRACPKCDEYPFIDSPVCLVCNPPQSEARRRTQPD